MRAFLCLSYQQGLSAWAYKTKPNWRGLQSRWLIIDHAVHNFIHEFKPVNQAAGRVSCYGPNLPRSIRARARALAQVARSLGRGSRVLLQDLGPNGSRIVGLGSRIVVRGPGTIPDKSVRVPLISGHKPRKIKHLARLARAGPWPRRWGL